MPLPILWHHDAAQVGMAEKAYPEKIEDFALEEVRRRPRSHQRLDRRIAARNSGDQTHSLLSRVGKQVVDDFKARFRREDVDAGDVGKKIEFGLWAFTKNLASLSDANAVYINGEFPAIQFGRFNQRRSLKYGYCRLVLELIDGRDWGV